jgi:predicted tellurium resistance membrane protein TerC
VDFVSADRTRYRRRGRLSGEASTISIWSAIRTIVIADAVMSLDNMLGVAGAAQGNLVLVVVGLVTSIPIMVIGSSLFLRLIDHYPSVIYIGAAVLAWTAGKMLIEEPLLDEVVKLEGWVPVALQATIVGGILLAGFCSEGRTCGAREQPLSCIKL